MVPHFLWLPYFHERDMEISLLSFIPTAQHYYFYDLTIIFPAYFYKKKRSVELKIFGKEYLDQQS